MKKFFFRSLAVLLILCLMPVTSALAWTDQSHMAVGLAAGYREFHNCSSADVSHAVASINGLTQTDNNAHFYNAPADYEITASDVYEQLQHLGQPTSEYPSGYLLGAILQAVRRCKAVTESGAFDEYYYAVLLHYVADMTQPLHIAPYDDFNRANHLLFDKVLEDKEAQYPVFAAVMQAGRLTVDDTLRFSTEEELVEAIVSAATETQTLANAIRAQERMITQEEAVTQLSLAATLGRAMLRYCGKLPS